MVVVADWCNHRLALWRLGDGSVWKHLGSKGREPGQFNSPQAVAVTGAGALVVSDLFCVQVLTVDGAVLCVLDPTAVVGVGRLGRYLRGVALYPGTDEILVTDCDNHRLVALSWSLEVCCYGLCCLHLICFCCCIGLMLGLSVFFSAWFIGCAGIWQSRRTIGPIRLSLWCRSDFNGRCVGGRPRKSSPCRFAIIFHPRKMWF